jgi:Mg-chelatase subunit ChlI
MVETARTIAAFAERPHITMEDLKEAAELALLHRTCAVPPRSAANEMEEEELEPEDTQVQQELEEEKEEQYEEKPEKNQLPEEIPH